MRWIWHAAAALALAVPCAHALPKARGEPSLTPNEAAPAPRLRIAPKLAPDARLPPVTDAEVQRVRRQNLANLKRLAIGVVRPVPAALALPAARDIEWKWVAGGYAGQAAVSSPQAGALRLAIELAGVPPDVEMVFFGSDDPSKLVGPVRVGDIKDRSVPYWSPVTDGEIQTVEFFVPARHVPGALPLRVAGASHLFTTLASGFTKRVSDIGASGSCNVDIKCSTLSSSQAFLNTRNSVAQMVFNDGMSSYLCTGTLLNDTVAATQAPWFYSANHCFEDDALPFKTASQMQAIANTLNTLWSFEAVSCNVKTTPPYTQLTGGATFIYNNPGADVLFLRLNNAAPAEAYFAGWDANALGLGTSVITIHHPRGDLKKVTEGSVVGYSSPPVLGGATTPFSEVRWDLGTTEGGSSGAGLFSFDGLQYLMRGGLWGGDALCSNPGGTDNYSQLDRVYSALAAYLNPTNSPTADYTDMWWNPNESGWGLNVIQHASGNIFAVWYTYEADGTRTWYHMPGGSWTSSNTFTGSIVASTGPNFAQAFDPNRVARNSVGTGTLAFSSANSGTWSYSINGVTGTKSITRLVY